MVKSGEQHMSSRATEEVIVDDDGRRWVREGAAPCPSWAKGVPAPVDADGNVVPLTTRMLYDEDGHEITIVEHAIIFSKDTGVQVWSVRSSCGLIMALDRCHLERPDSWERVEADIESLSHTENVCCYFGHGNVISCNVCPAEDIDKCCSAAVARDILRRAKALAVRGECE